MNKNILLFGEYGSGKTELALNLAACLAAEGPVDFFDMDGTKPVFRSRAQTPGDDRVVMHRAETLLDAPVIPPGADAAIRNEQRCCIFDIGGSVPGARMAAQLAPALQMCGYEAYLVVNPYRPFCNTAESLGHTLDLIGNAADLQWSGIIGNPGYGSATTAEDVEAGCRQVLAMASECGVPVAALTATQEVKERVSPAFAGQLTVIRRILSNPWNNLYYSSEKERADGLYNN